MKLTPGDVVQKYIMEFVDGHLWAVSWLLYSVLVIIEKIQNVGLSYGYTKEFCEIKNRHSNHLNNEHPKSEHLTFQTLFWSGFQMVRSRDLADLSNITHFRPQNRPFLSGSQTPIQNTDHVQTRHVWTIWIPDMSGIQMVTLSVFTSA